MVSKYTDTAGGSCNNEMMCPYCQTDTGGNHAWNCPNNPNMLENYFVGYKQLKNKQPITTSEISWGERDFTEEEADTYNAALRKMETPTQQFTTSQLHRIRTEAHAAGVAEERARVRAAVEAELSSFGAPSPYNTNLYSSGRRAAYRDILRILDPKEAE